MGQAVAGQLHRPVASGGAGAGLPRRRRPGAAGGGAGETQKQCKRKWPYTLPAGAGGQAGGFHRSAHPPVWPGDGKPAPGFLLPNAGRVLRAPGGGRPGAPAGAGPGQGGDQRPGPHGPQAGQPDPGAGGHQGSGAPAGAGGHPHLQPPRHGAGDGSIAGGGLLRPGGPGGGDPAGPPSGAPAERGEVL